MVHLEFREPILINGELVQFMDMRFERYLPDVHEIVNKGWYAELDNGKYLVSKGYGVAGLSSVRPIDKNKLPDDWWDHVHAMMADGTYKTPRDIAVA